MSNAILEQEPLTSWVIGVLATGLAAFETLAGDGVAPEEGGWEQGQPGLGQFTPYVTVVGGRAQPRSGTGGIGSLYADWSVTYELRATGASRKQVDWTGDRAISLLATRRMESVQLGEAAWKIVDVVLPMLGAPTRNDTTDPPYWEAADSVELWLSRRS